MNLRKLRELVKDSGAWSAAAHGAAKSLIRLSNRTATATSPLGRFWVSGPSTQDPRGPGGSYAGG